MDKLSVSLSSLECQIRDRRIRHILNLVFMNPRLRTSDLAAEVRLTPAHLEKLFKSELRMTITEYCRDLRLDRAQQLLLTSFQTEQEIALAVGIPDVSNFIRCFKKRFGVTPKSYRNSQSENSPTFAAINQ